MTGLGLLILSAITTALSEWYPSDSAERAGLRGFGVFFLGAAILIGGGA